MQHGGIGAAGRLPKRSLLLCYPPPGDSMAFDCLKKYRCHTKDTKKRTWSAEVLILMEASCKAAVSSCGHVRPSEGCKHYWGTLFWKELSSLCRGLGPRRRGACVCVVGEWDGDTAEPRFTAALAAGFRLAQRVPLPNWSDSAHELTIWRRQTMAAQPVTDASADAAASERCPRRDGAAAPSEAGLPLAACAACGKPAACDSGNLGGGGGAGGSPTAAPLRRCRHCRDVAYCSKACRKAHGRRHGELHALRLLFSGRKLRFGSAADFEPLQL